MNHKLTIDDVFKVNRPIDDYGVKLGEGYYRIVMPGEAEEAEIEDYRFMPREEGEDKESFEKRRDSLIRHQTYTFHKINPESGKKIGKLMEHNAMVFDFRYLATGVAEQADLPIITWFKLHRKYKQSEELK